MAWPWPRRPSWTRERTMLSLYRTLSLRYLSRRWFRAPVIVGKELDGDLPKDMQVLKVQKNHLAKVHNLARVGYVEAKGDAAALGGYVLILDLASAGSILDLEKGQVNRLDIVVRPKADR